MKTQLAKPARRTARYTEEYKKEALELWRASGRSAAKVAAELGIRPPLLYRWAHAERVPDAPKAGRKPKRSLEELEAENRRLRQENAKLLEQREVLKKSLWASSPKRRREICPNRTDERPIQSRLVMRGSSGLAQWVTTIGKSDVANPDHANWKTSACASASERNLLAVARLTAAHDWLMRWVVRDGATALPALCAWSGSSLDSAPSIERPSLIAATADPSRLTDCTTSLFDAPIKSGSAMPPQC